MKLTYLFDPLCGWCYGASAIIDGLAAEDGVTLELSPTGLFAGEGARPLDAQFAAYAWQNDERIGRMTGQPFSEAYRTSVLGVRGGMFDSAPATLALVAVGLTQPESERAALKALQAARYVEGRNTAEIEVAADVMRLAGFTAAADRMMTRDDVLMTTYRQRVTDGRRLMQRFGADGVPALIVDIGGRSHLLRSRDLFGGASQRIAALRAA